MPTPSVEQTVRSRLLPKLSFRSVMITVTLAAIVAWIGRLAWEGKPLPMSLLYTLLSLILFFVASLVLFLMAWVPAFLLRRLQPDAREGNPFAADQLPPQVLPPRSEGIHR